MTKKRKNYNFEIFVRWRYCRFCYLATRLSVRIKYKQFNIRTIWTFIKMHQLSFALLKKTSHFSFGISAAINDLSLECHITASAFLMCPKWSVCPSSLLFLKLFWFQRQIEFCCICHRPVVAALFESEEEVKKSLRGFEPRTFGPQPLSLSRATCAMTTACQSVTLLLLIPKQCSFFLSNRCLW